MITSERLKELRLSEGLVWHGRLIHTSKTYLEKGRRTNPDIIGVIVSVVD